MRQMLTALAVLLVFATGVAVGRASATPDRAAELTWSVAGELSRPRAYARAVAVDTGEILVLGGLDAHDEAVTITTTEVFDPATGKAIVLPQRLLGRLNQAVTVAWGGRVVVSGGTEWLGDHWSSVAKVDVYLPWSRTWLRAPDMRQPRSDHGAAALLDGRVLVSGGNYNARLLAASEIYDPVTDEWTAATPLPRARTMHSAATLPDGRVLVAGGFEADGSMTRATLLYEPWGDRWTLGPEMREHRLNHSMVVLPGGDLLFFGGEPNGGGTAERYLWRERRFVHAGVLGEPRLVAQGAALPDGSVVAVGGLPEDPWRQRFVPTSRAERWDAEERLWRDISDAPTKRAYAQLVATDHGLYRLSGVGEDEIAYTTIEILNWR